MNAEKIPPSLKRSQRPAAEACGNIGGGLSKRQNFWEHKVRSGIARFFISRSASGSIFLRNVIFVLLIALVFLIVSNYESCESKEQEKFEQVLEKIERIKPGMTRMQVEGIIGSPHINEIAPFKRKNAPFEDPETRNGQDAKNLLIAHDRAHYELNYIVSDDLRAYCLDVYYDSRTQVCFIHYGQRDKKVWDLVEMY